LLDAGVVILGKTNCDEFAMGSSTENSGYGVTRNPWDATRVPGGSSGGSAAAVAARMAFGALGTDTGGSIRQPASFCGIVGLKPTYGRVSRAGIIPLSWSLDHAGPMARTVADTALLLRAIAGPDPRDPTAALQAVPDYQAALGGGLQGVRIGVPDAYFFEQADPDVVGAVRTALQTMQQLGAVVREVRLPHAPYGPAASWAIAYTESFAFHRANFFARPRDYTAAFLHKIAGAACLTAEERLTAQRVRQVITAECLAALREVDAIVTPTTAYPAYPIGGASPQVDMHSLTRPVSLTGLPALAVPCGFTRTGLPVSMQLIGRAWEESTVLRIGHAYEQATDWHRRRPPLRPEPLPAVPPPAPSEPGEVDARWVLDFARLTGLSFIDEADAVPIAASIAPVKALLAGAHRWLDAGIEPPARPAPDSVLI
jgi:aspartyl-tRNA(Asn)/glutamyl-tRNA(Gln) amidotransferase subunit A